MAFATRRQASLADKLKSFSFWGLFLTLFSLGLSACPDVEPGFCQTSYDCSNDQVCVDGSCRQTCNYTSECEAGLQCFNGACVPPRNNADSGGQSSDSGHSSDSAHSDSSSTDGSARDHNSAEDRQLDSSGFDSGPADIRHDDLQTADLGPATDAQAADSNGNDAAISDADNQDVSANPCDSLNCPSNMHCESSGDSAQCLCGSVACTDGENCVLPETAHASGTVPICCAASEHNCNSQCVDFANDSYNCGDCNQACDYGETCISGACDCGTNGPCAANLECCNGHCIDVLNDSNNCGELGSGAGCEHVCNSGQPCTQGACGCSIDTDCGTGGWTCSTGTCECAGVICAGECFVGGNCCVNNECSTTDNCTNWGSCDYNNSCDESASQSRSCPQMTCTDHNCVQSWHSENQVCTRNTDGDSCEAGTVYTDWSTCGGYDSNNSCDDTGIQTRSKTVYTCDSAVCGSATTTETQNCTRDTDGDSCEAGTVYGDWSTCIYAKVCDETGTQTRSKTVYTCSNAACGSTTTTETQNCTRDTDGDSCDSTIYGDYGDCDFTNACDESATKTRSMTTYTCISGVCTSNVETDSMSCTRDTENVSCGIDRICCSESCVSSTDEQHCANCETQCQSSWACEGGTCNVAH